MPAPVGELPVHEKHKRPIVAVPARRLDLADKPRKHNEGNRKLVIFRRFCHAASKIPIYRLDNGIKVISRTSPERVGDILVRKSGLGRGKVHGDLGNDNYLYRF